MPTVFISYKLDCCKAALECYLLSVRDMLGSKNLIEGTLDKYEVIKKEHVEDELRVINKKYQFPASYKKANVHKHAVSFGFNDPKVKKKDRNSTLSHSRGGHEQSEAHYGRPKLCPCCNQPINTVELPMSYHTTSVDAEEFPYHLDSGTSMFFSFIKMAIIYLLMVFVVSDAFNLVTSIFGNYCDRHPFQCESNFFGYISTYNKYKDETMFHEGYTLDFLCMLTVVFSIFFFISYRKVQYNIYELIDAEHETQDDYSIFVEDIPILDFKGGLTKDDKDWVEFDYEQELKKIFEEKVLSWLDWIEENSDDLKPNSAESDLASLVSLDELRRQDIVKSVSLCFDLTELEKVQAAREKLMEEEIAKNAADMKNDSYIHRNSGSKDLTSTVNQIEYLNGIEIELCQKYAVDNTPIFNISHFVGKAFVSFQYQHYREHIIQKCEEDPLGFAKYEGQTLRVERATEPSDIFWQNMRVTDAERRGKVVSSYLIIAMIIVFGACALVIIDLVKTGSIEKGGDLETEVIVFNYGLTAVASLITIVINYGISWVNYSLTEFEKHKTRTNEQTSLILKLLVTQFVNYAFIYYLISILNWRPFMSSAGLIVQVSFLLVVSGAISIVKNAVNVPNIIRFLTLYWKYGYTSYEEKREAQVPTFQIKLNKDFELPVFRIESQYSYYLLQVYTALFYSYLIPVGVPVVALIFACQFWIDKFNMFKTSSQYYKINYALTRSVLKLFEGSLLMFTLGNFLFSIIIHDRYINFINLASLIIALLYVGFITFSPSNLERKLFAKYETLEQLSYDDCIRDHKFHFMYWTENPGTLFVKEVNINNIDEYMDQGSDDEYYDMEEFIDEWARDQIHKSQPNDDGW